MSVGFRLGKISNNLLQIQDTSVSRTPLQVDTDIAIAVADGVSGWVSPSNQQIPRLDQVITSDPLKYTNLLARRIYLKPWSDTTLRTEVNDGQSFGLVIDFKRLGVNKVKILSLADEDLAKALQVGVNVLPELAVIMRLTHNQLPLTILGEYFCPINNFGILQVCIAEQDGRYAVIKGFRRKDIRLKTIKQAEEGFIPPLMIVDIMPEPNRVIGLQTLDGTVQLKIYDTTDILVDFDAFYSSLEFKVLRYFTLGEVPADFFNMVTDYQRNATNLYIETASKLSVIPVFSRALLNMQEGADLIVELLLKEFDI